MDHRIIPIYLGLKTIQDFSAATFQKRHVMKRLLIAIVLVAIGLCTSAGTGVVRDGLIITSGICPYMALKEKMNDGTEQLALALVAAMKDRK